MNNVFFYRSPLGTIRVSEQDGALVSAAFIEEEAETAPSSSVLCDAKTWLDRYFQGSDPGPVPPLAPAGTAFQKAVWNAIGTVPFGKTVSYGALAVSMGLTCRHARAVGGALHRNPLLLFIPCHRAIGSDGSLTGFAGGMDRKKALLELEQNPVSDAFRPDRTASEHPRTEIAGLLIRPMSEADEAAFTAGISDRALRIAYGFPKEANPSILSQIFRNFCRLEKAYSIVEKNKETVVGFLLDVDPELPEDLVAGLPEKGRTLAFAVFPPYQRQGYMRETLKTYVSRLFETGETAYIHCGHFIDNEPSRRLLCGLGFHKYASHAFQNRVIEDEILFR